MTHGISSLGGGNPAFAQALGIPRLPNSPLRRAAVLLDGIAVS